MLWTILSVACIGILLGLWLRAASVVAASFLLVVISTTLLPVLAGWSLLKLAGTLFVLLSALQCGYLVGAIIASSKTRTRCAANAARRRPGGPLPVHQLLFGPKSAHK
jgi:hypothetical protein